MVSGSQSLPVRESINKGKFQIIARDFATPDAKKLAWDVYTELTSRFGLILPVAIVNGITYNAIDSAQINGIQTPYNLGADEEGRTEFTTNYKIIFTEGG